MGTVQVDRRHRDVRCRFNFGQRHQHPHRAIYTGDTNFSAGTSSPLTQTGLSNTAITVASSENPALGGDDVIFTAHVTGNDGAGDPPTGNVEFFDDGVDLGGGPVSSSGTATFDTAGSLIAGSHPITAQYQGDSNYAVSLSNTLTETVAAPSIAAVISSSTLPGAIVAGSKVHGTVTIALTNQTSNPISADQITVFASSDGGITNATQLATQLSKHGIPLKAWADQNPEIGGQGLPHQPCRWHI